jgi:hypothetical protein
MDNNVHKKEKKMFVTDTPGGGVFRVKYISANKAFIHQ